MLCCAVLCCAVLCCAVLCCAVLCQVTIRGQGRAGQGREGQGRELLHTMNVMHARFTSSTLSQTYMLITCMRVSHLSLSQPHSELLEPVALEHALEPVALLPVRLFCGPFCLFRPALLALLQKTPGSLGPSACFVSLCWSFCLFRLALRALLQKPPRSMGPSVCFVSL